MADTSSGHDEQAFVVIILVGLESLYCLLVLNSVTSTLQWIRYLNELGWHPLQIGMA